MKTLKITALILICLMATISFAQNNSLPQLCKRQENNNILSSWKKGGNTNYGILHTGILCPTRVGIGTGSPLANLDVRGKGLFRSLEITQGHPVGVKVVVPDISFLQAYSVVNSVTNQDMFKVMSNGHVFAQDMTIQLAPFPDYVFAKEYELMSIKQLGDYISKNKHLPNMPTAKKVEKEGVSVGELQLKLVEKVEELTLYIIDLQKQINLLKANK